MINKDGGDTAVMRGDIELMGVPSSPPTRENPDGGTSAGGQSVNWGTHEGDIDHMGGPNFDRLYHKLKVLLLLSCSYTMQFVGYNSIKTR